MHLCDKAVEEVRNGAEVLILSDYAKDQAVLDEHNLHSASCCCWSCPPSFD